MALPTLRLGSKSFLDVVKARRTHYALSDASPVSDSKIVEIVQDAVKHSPSPFNSQSGRAVVLFGEESRKAWQIVKDKYVSTLAPEGVAVQSKKVDGYSAGYGTVLVYEDQAVIEASQKRNAGLKDSFPIWSENSTGMLQYVLWVALESEGLGVSLQHHASYHPDVPLALSQAFDIPSSWKCTAMMPFGTPTAPPAEKTFLPIEERVKVVGGKL